MRTQSAAAKNRNHVHAAPAEKSEGLAISRKAIATMGAASALIGLWAVACFVGALITSGPVGVAKGWFQAVMGL